MILLIDNYDSFTYNIVQYLREMAAEVQVARNDAITVAEVTALNPAAIIISPGSGHPKDTGICREVIRAFAAQVPILGISLGHLTIGATFGATVTLAKQVMHGKVSEITCCGEGIFKGLGERPFKAMCYHSLALERASLPPCLQVTAQTAADEIMAITHSEHQIYGVQFHPESIMTPVGKRILRNFLKLTIRF